MMGNPPVNNVDKRLIRLAYAGEFLLALIAVDVFWTHAAGQGHIDLIYWYWKLGLSLAVAYGAVAATAAAVEGERAWNARSLRWLLAVAALLAGCALVTYYAHLYYEDTGEESDEDESALTMGASHAKTTAANCEHRRRRGDAGLLTRAAQ